jgi:RNA 2',3'-cyclic 3'-phosphodiesterase
MIRAFLALPLPESTRARLAALQFILPMRAVPPENLHLTLVFLGEQSEAVLSDLHDLLEGLRAPRLALALQGLDVFGGDKMRHVHARVQPNADLTRLQARLETLARQAGIAVPTRRFVPHVTLGHPDTPPDPRLAPLIAQTQLDPAPFDGDAVVMYRSILLRGGGSAYDELARYPLI